MSLRKDHEIYHFGHKQASTGFKFILFFGMFEIKLFSFVFVENGILRFFGREKLKLKCLLKKLPGETLCKRAFSLKATLKLIL